MSSESQDAKAPKLSPEEARLVIKAIEDAERQEAAEQDARKQEKPLT